MAAQHQAQNKDGRENAFQRVAPGEALGSSNDQVVVVKNSSCSKIDLLIADLVYRVDEDLVKALNTFLLHEEAPFGGYYFVWDAAQELQRLTAKKSNKAAALKGFLGSFAQQYGFSVAAFEEWQEVMYAKNRRDHTGYPLETRTEDLTFLRGLMDKADSCIQPYKNAVFALVVAAEKMGLK